jgi:hypothetical protein
MIRVDGKIPQSFGAGRICEESAIAKGRVMLLPKIKLTQYRKSSRSCRNRLE